MAVMRMCSPRCSAKHGQPQKQHAGQLVAPDQRRVQHIARHDARQQDANIRDDEQRRRNFDGADEKISGFRGPAPDGADVRRLIHMRRHGDLFLWAQVIAPRRDDLKMRGRARRAARALPARRDLRQPSLPTAFSSRPQA
jgi:hypothetical protein